MNGELFQEHKHPTPAKGPKSIESEPASFDSQNQKTEFRRTLGAKALLYAKGDTISYFEAPMFEGLATKNIQPTNIFQKNTRRRFVNKANELKALVDESRPFTKDKQFLESVSKQIPVTRIWAKNWKITLKGARNQGVISDYEFKEERDHLKHTKPKRWWFIANQPYAHKHLRPIEKDLGELPEIKDTKYQKKLYRKMRKLEKWIRKKSFKKM